MAHALEQGNGTVAFALRGEPAWHNLANKIFSEDEHISTADMLQSALLSSWDVRLEAIQYPEGYRGTTVSNMVVRTNPFDQGTDVLGVVGERYKVLQNEQLFEFGDNLLDGGGFWESAGSIKDGRVVFGSLALPRDIVLDSAGANDVTKLYLLVTTSHDGSASIQAMTTPVRVVCQNTLNVALNGATQSFKIRHTQSLEGRVAQARQALGMSFAYADEFEKQAQALYAQAITDKQFNDLVLELYPKPEVGSAKVAFTKWENKVITISDLYFSSPTVETVKGTKWGAFNALTERLDYFRHARNGTNEGVMAGASGFDAQVNAEKSRILSAVNSL